MPARLCPINSHPQSDGMCHEGECALWDYNFEKCTLVGLNIHIYELVRALKDTNAQIDRLAQNRGARIN